MSDDFYRAFEERYRGPRELVKERLRVYLPFVEPLKSLHPGAPAVDLGCGRGEWLELMLDVGVAARGVDLDDGMLAACRERGLPAQHGEALAFLRGLSDSSVSVVSAFHVAEHIPFADLQDLVREALRVLRPAGLLILETPNPENLTVGTSSFYFDPTHLRPLPPQLLSFLPEHYGFARTAVLRLQEPAHEKDKARLWDVLAGASPDFAVVSQKSGIAPEQLAPFDAAFATPHGVQLPQLAERYDAAAAARMQALAGDLATRLEAQEEKVGAAVSGLAAQVQALQAERDALRASLSWRITAPLRWVARPFMETTPRVNVRSPAAVATPLRPLVAAMGRVLRDPQRSYRLNQRLLRYPALHRWLVGLSKRAGIYPGVGGSVRTNAADSPAALASQRRAGGAEAAEQPMRGDPLPVLELTAAARRVYQDLLEARAARQAH
jgi:O-antigen chain-terminating methyltransferase